MPHYPKPFFRKDRKLWYVQIDGKQYNLGRGEKPDRPKYRKLLKDRELGLLDPAADPVAVYVDELLDRYLAWLRGNRAEATYLWYRDFLRQFNKNIPANLRIDQLKPYHVTEWVQSHKDWSASTRRGAIRAVQRACRWAEREELIVKSPVAHMEKPKEGRRTVILDRKEYEDAIAAIPSQALRELVVVAWETGARPQELTGIEARHCDPDNGRVVFPPEESKGGEMARVIYLSATALEIVRRRAAAFPSGPIFRTPRGKKWEGSNLCNAFTRLEKMTGKRVCLYNFRHTFVTRSLTAGEDSVAIGVLIGHKDPSMIARVYQHLSQRPEHLQAVVDRVSNGSK